MPHNPVNLNMFMHNQDPYGLHMNDPMGMINPMMNMGVNPMMGMGMGPMGMGRNLNMNIMPRQMMPMMPAMGMNPGCNCMS